MRAAGQVADPALLQLAPSHLAVQHSASEPQNTLQGEEALQAPAHRRRHPARVTAPGALLAGRYYHAQSTAGMRISKVERILQDPQGTSDSDDETDEESWQVGLRDKPQFRCGHRGHWISMGAPNFSCRLTGSCGAGNSPAVGHSAGLESRGAAGCEHRAGVGVGTFVVRTAESWIEQAW